MIYLLCVLAPTLSFAFADGARAAPCLTEDEHGMGIIHVHEHVRVAQHLHDGGRAHDHAVIAAGFEPDAGLSSGTDPATPAGAHHKSAGGQCCGMACVSALPATITEIVQPDVPPSRCVSKNYRDVADNTPHQLYRPPNT